MKNNLPGLDCINVAHKQFNLKSYNILPHFRIIQLLISAAPQNWFENRFSVFNLNVIEQTKYTKKNE